MDVQTGKNAAVPTAKSDPLGTDVVSFAASAPSDSAIKATAIGRRIRIHAKHPLQATTDQVFTMGQVLTVYIMRALSITAAAIWAHPNS